MRRENLACAAAAVAAVALLPLCGWLCSAAALLLVLLKRTGKLEQSWFWVLSPLWLPFLLAAGAFFLLGLRGLLGPV